MPRKQLSRQVGANQDGNISYVKNTLDEVTRYVTKGFYEGAIDFHFLQSILNADSKAELAQVLRDERLDPDVVERFKALYDPIIQDAEPPGLAVPIGKPAGEEESAVSAPGAAAGQIDAGRGKEPRSAGSTQAGGKGKKRPFRIGSGSGKSRAHIRPVKKGDGSANFRQLVKNRMSSSNAVTVSSKVKPTASWSVL